jgi:hypothetical protein
VLAGKRKSKGKSKASAKDAATAAEKRSSKVAAVANVQAKGKPRKLGVKDHVLNALPPAVSRWLKKHSKWVKWGILLAALIAVFFMWWLSKAADVDPAAAAFRQMQIDVQRLQEEQLRAMRAQAAGMPQPQHLPQQ